MCDELLATPAWRECVNHVAGLKCSPSPRSHRKRPHPFRMRIFFVADQGWEAANRASSHPWLIFWHPCGMPASVSLQAVGSTQVSLRDAGFVAPSGSCIGVGACSPITGPKTPDPRKVNGIRLASVWTDWVLCATKPANQQKRRSSRRCPQAPGAARPGGE